MRTAISLAATLLLAACTGPAHHAGHSSYAGQESRAIKALSEKEVAELLAGAGMGYAKAAELNRHPGPMHALEHADALQLTPVQRAALSRLMQEHKEEARMLGAQVVELERELDGIFARGAATDQAVDAVLARWGAAQARLRGAHLKTHLRTTALLTPQQVDRYLSLRGYRPHH